MKQNLLMSGLLITALFLGIACQKASTANLSANNANKAVPANDVPKAGEPTQTADDAPRISLEDAKKDFDAGSALFIDTRAADSYKIDHIKGSINVSADMLEAKYKELPKDRKIIAYCS